MGPNDDLVDSARQWFDEITGTQREDVQPGRLRYHLLRLTVCGLRHEDIPALLELGRLAFQGSPVADQVARITEDPGSSTLACVLANIVRDAASGGGPTRQVMLGSVLGAYLGVPRSEHGDDATVHGAVAGGSEVWASSMVEEFHQARFWADYTNPSDE